MNRKPRAMVMHHFLVVTLKCAFYLKGLFQVRSGDDSVLVVVDDAERLLELLDLFLREQGEDV